MDIANKFGIKKVFQPAADVMQATLNDKAGDVLLLPYNLSPGYKIRNNKTMMGVLHALTLLSFAWLFIIWIMTTRNTAMILQVPFPLNAFFLCLSAYLSLRIRQDRLYLDSKLFYLPGDTMKLGRALNKISLHTMAFTLPVRWARVIEIAIVDNGKSEAKPEFAIRFVTAQLRGSLRLSYDLKLRGLERSSLRNLAAHIEKHAAHAKGLYLLKELERFHDFQMGLTPQMSYNELWESTHKSAFSLTSFNPLAPGSKIQDGRFTVDKQIAAGGFSAIYLISSGDGEKYVLKESCLPLSLSAESRAKAMEQFQREALLLAKLDHPQIAQVYDHFTEDDRNYMRLEYLEGETLREHVSKAGPQKEELVLDWFKQLAGILVYLHELSPPVVHRDLAPDNIILRADGRLGLIDFGAANEFVGAATGTLVGRHAYMATEQIKGRAEPRSDIYSLGASIFFCLTNREPSPLRSSSPKTAGFKVTDRTDQIINKCTRLDLTQRFASAENLLAVLKGKAQLEAESAATH
jgi:Protein kinase domain